MDTQRHGLSRCKATFEYGKGKSPQTWQKYIYHSITDVLRTLPDAKFEAYFKLGGLCHRKCYMVLYICGNHSTILSRLDRRFQDLEIRRAFTVFQLMTILEVVRHYWIIIECDPLLYEDATGMIDLASQEMSDAAKEAAVLLYSPGTDTFLEDLARNADRVFYFDEGPRATTKLISKAYRWQRRANPPLSDAGILQT
jgi:hypothetical protein